jgi:hypothetical protein
VVGDPQSTLGFVVPFSMSHSLPWPQNDWLGLHPPGLGNPVVEDPPSGVRVKKRYFVGDGCKLLFAIDKIITNVDSMINTTCHMAYNEFVSK